MTDAERIQQLTRELNDAVCVITGMGISRYECPSCHRRTITKGFCCWACGHDDTADDDES